MSKDARIDPSHHPRLGDSSESDEEAGEPLEPEPPAPAIEPELDYDRYEEL